MERVFRTKAFPLLSQRLYSVTQQSGDQPRFLIFAVLIQLVIGSANIPHKESDICKCVCIASATNLSIDAAITKAEAESKATELEKVLRVEKKWTFMATQKRTSLPDERKSAQSLGIFATIFITSVFGFIIVLDFPALIRDMTVGPVSRVKKSITNSKRNSADKKPEGDKNRPNSATSETVNGAMSIPLGVYSPPSFKYKVLNRRSAPGSASITVNLTTTTLGET